MSEFDLDPRIQGVAGFGWEAYFRLLAGRSRDHRIIAPVERGDSGIHPVPGVPELRPCRHW